MPLRMLRASPRRGRWLDHHPATASAPDPLSATRKPPATRRRTTAHPGQRPTSTGATSPQRELREAEGLRLAILDQYRPTRQTPRCPVPVHRPAGTLGGPAARESAASPPCPALPAR